MKKVCKACNKIGCNICCHNYGDRFNPKTKEKELELNLYDILETDMPCMVRSIDVDDEPWNLRYYAGDGKFYVDGRNSTSDAKVWKWNQIRLPTPEEAPLFTRIPYHPSLGRPEGIDEMLLVVWIEDDIIKGLYMGRDCSFDEGENAITAYMIMEK